MVEVISVMGGGGDWFSFSLGTNLTDAAVADHFNVVTSNVYFRNCVFNASFLSCIRC